MCKFFDNAFLEGKRAAVVHCAYLPHEAIAEPEPDVEQAFPFVCTKECSADPVYSLWAQKPNNN